MNIDRTTWEQNKPWWWLSFADPEKPRGERNLGVCIVQGLDIGEAAKNAHAKGCNPGGEIMGVRIAEDKLDLFPEQYRNRLMSGAEVMAAGLA